MKGHKMKYSSYTKILFFLCLIITAFYLPNTVYAESSLVTDETSINMDIDCTDVSKPESKSNIVYDLIIPLIIEFIGAFLGFFFAIQLENRTKRQQIKSVYMELLNELKTIADDIRTAYVLTEDSNGSIIEGNVDIVFLYQTPKWDILLASGELSAILNDAKSSNIDLLSIYSDIFLAQNLEKEYLTAKRNQNMDDSFFNEYIEKIKAKKLEMAIQIYTKIIK